MDYLAFIKRLKVRPVVGDQDSIAIDSVSGDRPIRLRDATDVDQMIGFEACLSCRIDESRAQTLVDEKPHCV